LGLRAVNLFVHDDLMADETKADRLRRFLERLREHDITIILTADYPVKWLSHPPSHRQDILDAMLPFHRFLARRYRPDILVPFIEPYGAFVVVANMELTPAEWMELLAAAAEAVRAEAPSVRCAVYFGQSENDRALYQWVCQPGGPVDVVGFSFYAVYQTREAMEASLAKAASWMNAYGRGKEHWLFEFGQSPLTMGGERAQSHYVQWVTHWAMRQPDVRGACVFALRDYEEKLGLLSAPGHRRQVYWACRRLARGAPLPQGGKAGDSAKRRGQSETLDEGRPPMTARGSPACPSKALGIEGGMLQWITSPSAGRGTSHARRRKRCNRLAFWPSFPSFSSSAFHRWGRPSTTSIPQERTGTRERARLTGGRCPR
jgi:hypothetical protein